MGTHSWYFRHPRLYKIIISLLIVSILVSPISSPDAPLAPKDTEAAVVGVAPLALAAWCAVGMAISGATSVLYEKVVHNQDPTITVHEPFFWVSVTIGCLLGPFSHWYLKATLVWGSVSTLLGEGARHILVDIALHAARDAYLLVAEREIEENVTDRLLADNDYSVKNIYSVIHDESAKSPALQSGLAAFYNDLNQVHQDNYGIPLEGFESLQEYELSITPSGSVVYQSGIVKVEVLSETPFELCTDPNRALSSPIQYVEFGYSISGNPSDVVTLPSANIPDGDGKDWYGCNGFALDFDMAAAEITHPTQLYLAARALDIEDSITPWTFSAQITADPRYKHDYALSNFQFEPQSPNVGNRVDISVRVTNEGATDEAAINVEFYVDGRFDNSHYIGPLDTGESTTTSFPWMAVEGAHTLEIIAELDGDQDPSDDSATHLIFVGIAPHIWVNGAANPSTVQISASTLGTAGDFDALLQNVGSAPTTVSIGKHGPQSAWLALSDTEVMLDASDSQPYSFSINVPSGTVPGGHYSAELHFDWPEGPTIVLPIQFDVTQYEVGLETHSFTPSSGAINGAWQSTMTKGWHTYVNIDNFPDTDEDLKLSGSFNLDDSEYHRIEANSEDEWQVDVWEGQSASSSSGVRFQLGDFSTGKTSDFDGAFDILDQIDVGPNNWQIGLIYVPTFGSDTVWHIDETKIRLVLTESAWWSSYNPGDSTVNAWKAGWDYAQICATVSQVAQAGEVALYNNGNNVAAKTVDSSDVGDQLCWRLQSGEIFGANDFNFKANVNEANVDLADITFDVHYFTGSPAIQADRSLSKHRADLDENVAVTLIFDNVGSNIAEDTAFNESLPAQLQLVSGELSDEMGDIDPEESDAATYAIRGTTPGSYIIPGSLVTYSDPSDFSYSTLLNTSVVEIWGGSLQPVLYAPASGEIGESTLLTASVSSSLVPDSVEHARVIADIAQPDGVVQQIALIWNAATGQYEGVFTPSQPGDHSIVVNAERPFYDPGASEAVAWYVDAANAAPIARATHTLLEAGGAFSVELSAGDTVDVDGVIVGYEWDIGNDGSADLTGRTAQWAFAHAGDYPVKLTVVDNRHAEDSHEFVVSVGASSVELSTQVGWNLLSLPLEPQSNMSAESLCETIGAHIAEINRWFAGGWNSHICGLPFNDFPVEVGSGYFAKATEAASWSYPGTTTSDPFVLELDAGWNLVSLPSGFVLSVEELGNEINHQGGSCSEADRWYAGGWASHVIGLPFNDFSIESGSGYFVKCAAGSSVTLSRP